MKIQSFNDMKNIYLDFNGWDNDYDSLRNEMLNKFSYSVCVEGAYPEFEDLEAWISNNIGPENTENTPDGNWSKIWYGKTDYDYGFNEYFVSTEPDIQKIENVVPQIFSNFGTGKYTKTEGSENFIEVDEKPPIL